MFSCTALDSESADSRDVRFKPLLLGRISSWSELDERVQRDFHPRGLFLWYVHVISVDTPQDGLMGDDDDVLASLEFHDDWLKPDDNISVAFATSVSIIIFVIISSSEVFWISIGNLLVGETITGPGIKFIQSLPFKFIVAF